ncbi:MAG: PilZ domain-containing protein [Capsulimonas sp.]|uniref:flagellar brake protein n=1 Tax=Capsulimonas sp. TaxID=2494211 RepID=UPI003265962A
MDFWKLWTPIEEQPARTSSRLPTVGEAVRIQLAQGDRVGVYYATVRMVTMRRLVLDTAEQGIFDPEGVWDTAKTEAPASGPAGLALPARAAVVVSFVRGSGLFKFSTRVVGSSRSATITILRPRQVTQVQRREFFRLPLHAPTSFRVSSRGGDGSIRMAGRLVNISGGGALLAAPKPIPGGLRVTVRVPAGNDGEQIDVEAESLDCHIASQGTSRIYLVRLAFLGPPEMSEDDREAIIAYIFEQQRIVLRNRKLMR